MIVAIGDWTLIKEKQQIIISRLINLNTIQPNFSISLLLLNIKF